MKKTWLKLVSVLIQLVRLKTSAAYNILRPPQKEKGRKRKEGKVDLTHLSVSKVKA